ncbi:MAG: MFS transporter [Proteobacteria bacterium]|nr:MFS transporter [Pseudomonadota bacterium]
MTSQAETSQTTGVMRPGRYRWAVCGLLFAATAINYIDRQTLALLKGPLSQEFHWGEQDYADLVFWFQAAYAAGYIVFGGLVDRLGARVGYAVAVILWTIAHIGHGFVSSFAGFKLMRIGLGLGESGNFPSGVKAVTEWFPKRERALAIGVFNAGSNIGAIIAPLLVPIVTLTWGWQAAFIVTGLIGVVWLVAWIAIYRRPDKHPKVGTAELALIRSDPPDTEAKIPWLSLLWKRETWAYALGKFLIDPIWWMYLFWLPDFLLKRHHLDLKSFGLPLVAIYILSDVGSIFGGWMSSALLKSGRSLNFARKATMLVCALAVIPVGWAMYIDDLWTAVGVIGLAAAAHQAFSANLYAYPSDVFERRAVASVIGIGGTLGGVGGMFMAQAVGWVLATLGSYTPIFVVAASTYLVALLVVHLLSPRYAPAKV